ncbi:ER junction formation factor lunapark [Hyphodiscus hymeniophilus]|uniref:Endoplasmic reticulum junction formation protein lunapark n=1 Tax=Hyphodiscus hymeniophilus TaxID=353542 RepID=A0A9P6VDS5_9HELO|nr:ER junction formation factor lunapark [Hyphodiscus hymeniophilus]
MVSLWPWKGNDTSPASFEKALSALATKISKSQTQLDGLRQRGRRFKALWTLYTSFAYLLCVIILFLVVGWKNWTALEYTAVAGSPLFIYVIRTGITSYYNFRVDTTTQRLEAQQAERAKTIDKLKAATKYNSTQELLEKYGGAPPKAKKQPSSTSTPTKTPKNAQKAAQGRTSMGPPPPTANIARPNQLPSQPSTPQPVSRSPSYIISPPSASTPQIPEAQAEFAPNAFNATPQYATGGDMNMGGHWYDRVLDLLLGEDETSPKNRIILICQNCRLVNGQAPPGTKSLVELGKWKCFGCGELNGEEDEAVKAVQEMKETIHTHEDDSAGEVEQKRSDKNNASPESDKEKADNEGDDDNEAEVEDEIADDTNNVSKPRRGRSKGSKKKS